MRFDVVSLGEAMVEFNQIQPGVPQYLQGFGGDTSNVAIAAARQGARASYLTRIGDDEFGHMLLDLWQREHVDTANIVRDPAAPTAVYFVSHSEDGHRFTYLRAGSAASRMAPENLPLSSIAEARWLHVSAISQAISASARDTVEAAISLARQHGVRVSYDPNLRLKLWPMELARRIIVSTISRADLFLPSLEDIRALSGLSDIGSLFRWSFGHGAYAVVLKCGAEGAWWAMRGQSPQKVSPYRVVAVDATGAGDCFDGSLLARLSAGDAMAEAVRYANMAAALSTTGMGAIAPIPSAQKVRDVMHGASQSSFQPGPQNENH